MDEKYDTDQRSPSNENLDSLETAEELPIDHTPYQACSEYGEMQEEYLKALDFMEMLTENLGEILQC
eukprot:2512493-Prorocentrum_lima.AAC.1